MKILGVRIDNLTKKEILNKIEFFLNENKFHTIVTVNPEFILLAKKDDGFKNILNQTDLNIADGIGLKYAFIKNFKWLKTRFAGADLLDEILKLANNKKLSIFLATNKNGLSQFEEIKSSVSRKYPDIQIDGENIIPKEYYSYKIQNTAYDMLLCNFGAPWQEKFIDLQKDGNMKLAIGIGGAFDFMTGKIKRAPKFMRFLGLEWLFRLIQEPTYRIKRIFNAVIIFPLAVIFSKNDE